MFVWDEKKRKANIEKHSLDFKLAPVVFLHSQKATFTSYRYGERYADIAFVKVLGAFITLVYTKRGDDIRVISLRKSSRRERRVYPQQSRRN